MAHRPCDNFLYSFRAHPRRAGASRPGHGAREAGAAKSWSDERSGWPAVGGRGQSRAARRWRCGSFRRALRAEALRRAELPRAAAPVTGRMRCPPYRPGAAPVREGQAVSPARVAPSPERSQRRGRNAAHCPGRPLQVNGAPHPASGTLLRLPRAPCAVVAYSSCTCPAT